MYENKKQKVVPISVFYRRLMYNMGIALVLIAICLAIGVAGYRITTGMDLIDALHQSSMILGGMGPVVTITTFSGKIFSSFYALFSGVAFITNIGIILAPAAHRLYHRLHVEYEG
jgi:hypothetical protein